jgi:predicted aspartyl protease
MKTLDRVRRTVTDPIVRAVIDVRTAASALDVRAARAAFGRIERLGASPRWRAVALATLAGVEFATGGYADAERATMAWLSLPDGTDSIHARSDIEQMRAVASGLARLPGQRVVTMRRGSSPTWRDKATLVRTMVSIGGRDQVVVLDTGANLSVMSETTARRLGLKTIGGGSVRSSSRDAVTVRLAIARRLEIAGTVLRDVAFLVMADADLHLPLPGGYDIPAIVGFPVLRALGRVAFTRDRLIAERSSARAAPRNLTASGSDLFVEARVNGEDVPLHLDTGASRTSLGPRFAADHPAMLAGLVTRSEHSAGAGGSVEAKTSVLPNAEIEIAGIVSRQPSVDVAVPGGQGNFGTVGQDVLRLPEGGFTIDFDQMSLTLNRPPARR